MIKKINFSEFCNDKDEEILVWNSYIGMILENKYKINDITLA